MKIKRQFIILSFIIISIPILCSIFVIIHTYIHSPNRYLIKGSAKLERKELSLLSEKDLDMLERSLKMLPEEVEAVLCRISDRKIIYSTIPDIEVGRIMQKNEIWNYATETSDKYFYQFSRLSSLDYNIILVTRLTRQRLYSSPKTSVYLRVLFLIIIIVAISLILLLIISKSIFTGLNTIQSSSSRLAEGKLDTPITINSNNEKQNEFNCILRSLETMRCELQEMQERKNRFIMGISHDLRTPVAVIKGYSEAIQDDVISDKDEIKKSIELIEQKATQLEGMIDTLINFMKLNNKEIKENLIKESITEIITDFAKYAQVTGTLFKRNIKTNISIDKDIQIPLNVQLVQRSFENLLSNAIRYTRENDLIEIAAHTEKKGRKSAIILQIKDTGYGIDKKDLDYIFELFYRGTNSRKEEGMGIGLAVVKNIMDTHGWKISVESQKGYGSCFTIKIPYKD